MGGVEDAKPTGIVRAGIVFGTTLAVSVQTLDATIAAVALPRMQGSLSASQDEINWVITSYIVAVAIMTAPAAWLAARYGRKRILILALGGFTAASVLTGFAQSLDQVVLFRFLQGAFGAPIVPLAQSLLLDSFETRDSMRALSWWSLGGVLGPVVGPNLGGWITENWDWRWVFFINVPIGLAGLIALGAFVPETKKLRAAFDWFGFASLSLFFIGFQLTLDRGSEKDWFDSSEIVAEACLAGLGLYVFTIHSLTTPRPFVDFATLRDRNFASGTFYTFVNSMLLITLLVLLPAFLQNLVGEPVGMSGTVMTPRSIGSGLGLIVLGRLGKRLDPRILALAGLSTIAYSTFSMASWNANVSTLEVALNGFCQGAGSGIAFVSMQTLTFARITPAQRNGAATIFGLARNFGQSIGVSTATALLVRNVQINHAEIAAHVTPFNRALQWGGAARFWNMNHMAGRVTLEAEIGRQAAAIAYTDDFRALVCVTLAVIPVVFLLRRPGQPTEARR